jgi:hypothetical protein
VLATPLGTLFTLALTIAVWLLSPLVFQGVRVLVLLSVILFTQVITLTFWLFTLEFQEV